MKPSSRLAVIFTVSTLSFYPTAGSAMGSAPQRHGAERVVQQNLYDLSDSFFTFPCSADGELLPETDGELIDIEGHIFERISAVADGAGGHHFNLNTMPVGLRGVGESGEEFRISETDLSVANQRLDGIAGTFREELKLVGRDTHRTFWLRSSGHYLIAADGTIKVSRDTLTTECRQ